MKRLTEIKPKTTAILRPRKYVGPTIGMQEAELSADPVSTT
jgi:hypothetical protein